LLAFIGGFVVYFMVQWLEANPKFILWQEILAFLVGFMITFFIAICAVSGSKMLHNYLLADILFMLMVTSVSMVQPRIIINAALCHLGFIATASISCILRYWT
jgi:hypothetical protein